ncbi:putative MFS family arabinose efflux permease [Mycobacterium frederiksbergense]|uniref:MFS family arabinose efflux permease n=1 Tax=Mycolicibacterium frederiksbergense TaxID=117567 RepID=A0ABT6KUL0_9MYCO|nr:MFS transporter [Mycolicibacterium frederiksbergense]MDH6194376.1 putative MFS family arabinose efflux permease [Mycolicibacterium frederiksbergense]
MPKWLFVLLFAAFVLYTDDYVIAGVLVEIARDLNTTEAAAGQLVTVFSVTVAIVAPVAAVVLARVSRRRLFTLALGVFVTANIAASVAPSLPVLMVLRVVAAGAAAATAPALFAHAAERAPDDRTGRYVAVVALGVTGSIAVGVPLGTWIGGHLGWRATFATMALAGIAALLLLLVSLPTDTGTSAEIPPRVADQLKIMAAAPISLGLLANTALMTGSMMMLTYLASYLDAVTGASVDQRALVFSLAGFAGTLGIWTGGIATDRWGPDRTLTLGIATFVGTMIGLWACATNAPTPFVVVLVIGTVWGAASFWNSPALQARLYLLAGPLASQALALNTSGTYLGVALGGALGGLTLTQSGHTALPVIAGTLGVLALLLLRTAIRASPGQAPVKQ